MVGGLIAMRRLHLHVIEQTGLTAADEMLYPENHTYLADLLSMWLSAPVPLKISSIG
jgi:3-deoxy-7-phosphoheptulonate synthase